jgi:hypothetical protein
MLSGAQRPAKSMDHTHRQAKETNKKKRAEQIDNSRLVAFTSVAVLLAIIVLLAISR